MRVTRIARSTKRPTSGKIAAAAWIEAVECRRMLSGSPVITTEPTNQAVLVGANATFTAAASGTPAPTVQWQVSTNNGVSFSPDTADAGVTTNTLTVGATISNNGYEYEAIFTNSQGTATTTPATLSVNVPLTITMQPANQTTYIGGNATFTAAAEGTTTPITVQWEISRDNGYTFEPVGTASNYNSFNASSSFTVVNATSGTYPAQYEAEFSNSNGTSTTYPATLNLTQGLAITQQSYSQSVFPGGTATFTAAAAGLVTPTVQWEVSTLIGSNTYSAYTAINGATSDSLTVPSSSAGNLYEAVFTAGSYSVTSAPAILDLNLTKFTEGDLVVLRLGDAAYPDLPGDQSGYASTQMPVYLDEYTPAGSYVGSVAIPSSGPNALTLPGGGDDQHQGVLSLSTNGAILTFGGYQVPEGSPDANDEGGDDQPVLGYIYNNVSSLSTNTIVNSYGAGSSNPFFRGAFTNYGTSFWTYGKYAAAVRQSQSVNGNGGLEYVSGAGPNATTTDVETFADFRYITAINGQLYGGAGSSSIGTHGPYIVGNTASNVSSGIVTEPTTNLGQDPSDNSLLGTYPGGQSASAIAAVGLPDDTATQNGLNVIYTIGDQSGPPRITKYFWNGSVWTINALAVGINSAVDSDASFNPTGLIAAQDPANPNWVDLTVTGQDGIYTYVDKSGATGILAADSFTQLAEFPFDGEFRGVAVAPLPWEAPNSVASWNNYTKTLTVTGAAGIIADPGSDEPVIQANGSAAVLTINPTSSLQIHLGGLALTNGASAIVTSLGGARTQTNHRVLVVGVAGTATSPLFNIDSTSNLNLTDNDLVVHDGSLGSITGFLQSGYNAAAGYWNGNGIQSSVAASKLLTALGAGHPAAAGAFDGETVNTSDVEVRYTYYGDANLDGHVDGSDYSKIDNGYVHQLAGWSNGDFNYGGAIDGSDYTLIDNAFNRQSASLDSQVAMPDSVIDSGTAMTTACVPVPPNQTIVPSLITDTSRETRHRRLIDQLPI